MARRFQEITEVYRQEIAALARSDRWTAFLRSACRNYKLPFEEQVLVHAQRPDATAVLEIERWNRQFGRWVNKGATGIAVFDRDYPGRTHLKYYFDISDTHESRLSRPVPLWQVPAEQEPDVIEALENRFGALDDKGTLEEAMVLNDVTYAERENAGKAIIEACTHMNGAETVSIGSYRGFSMLLSYDGAANEFRMVLKGKLSHTAVLGADAGGNVTRIDNALEKITEHLANARSQLAHTTEQLENARTEMTAPFPKEAELAEKTRRLNELNVLLNLNEQDRPVMADEPDEP